MNTELTRKPEGAPARAQKNEDRAVVRPRVDVFENATEYLVVADLPGVPKEALEVHFDDGELRIKGTRASASPGQPLALEAHVADFERTFAMPDGIDADRIEAELATGVLRVRLPKASTKQARRIAVRGA